MSATCLEFGPAQRDDGGAPLRVLVLRSVDGPGGGAESIILRTAAAIDPQRVELTVCCIHRPDDPLYDFDRRAAQADIDYVCVHQRSLRTSGVFARLREIVRERQIDIVDAQDYKAAFFAARLAIAENILPVATLHGWSGHHWRERLVYYPAERLIVRHFPLIIAVSGELAATMRRWGARRESLRVLSNAIDPQAFHARAETRRRMRTALALEPSQLVVGAVGRLEQEKRYDVLVEAFAQLHRRLPQSRLVLVGEGSRRAALQTHIERRQLGPVCRLLGHRRDVADLYQAFDVFAQASDHEGSPTVIVEAMALRVPVVATAVGGTADLLAHEREGLLVPRRNPTAMARALEHTLTDSRATQRRVDAARRRVEDDLSFAARTRQLEDFYRQLAVTSGRHPYIPSPTLS